MNKRRIEQQLAKAASWQMQMQASFGDCTEPWSDLDDYGELCHDDKIYLLEQRSTFSLISLTEKGVQTDGDRAAKRPSRTRRSFEMRSRPRTRAALTRRRCPFS